VYRQFIGNHKQLQFMGLFATGIIPSDLVDASSALVHHLDITVCCQCYQSVINFDYKRSIAICKSVKVAFLIAQLIAVAEKTISVFN